MNDSKSIRAKLKNIADSNNLDFQSCITRFLHERLIYRLSISEYRNFFVLKGGNLIYSLFNMKARPTIDIDFLGRDIENNESNIIEIFKHILSIKENDAVWFDKEKIYAENIAEQSKYKGIRLIFVGGFDTIKQNIHVDIGFGDTITPAPVNISFPVMLESMKTPDLLTYNTETVIAEKFQTMIFLADYNSRMKDFYDVFTLLQHEQLYDEYVLKDAIIATFKNRDTHYTENHILFADEFANNQTRNKMWNSFLKKIACNHNYEFTEVMQVICNKLFPIFLSLKQQ